MSGRAIAVEGLGNVGFEDIDVTSDHHRPPSEEELQEDSTTRNSQTVEDFGSNHPSLYRRRGGFSIANESHCHMHKHRALTSYFISEKGHELTFAVCGLFVMVITMIGLAIIFSNLLGSGTVSIYTREGFFTSMQILSTLAIWILLLLASLGKLTNDEHYRDQTETSFLRGGIVCLGTGGTMYYLVTVTSHALEPSVCLETRDIFIPMAAIIFNCSQIALILKYSRIRINKSLFLGIVSRFLISLIIATNLCVWINTVTYESEEEIKKLNEEDEHTNLYSSVLGFVGLSINESSDSDPVWLSSLETQPEDSLELNLTNACDYASILQHNIQPYTWPLLIEFCIVASTCLIAIMERCGQGLEVSCNYDNFDRQRSPSLNSYDMDVMAFDDGKRSIENEANHQKIDSHDKKLRYYNSQLGFLAGWLMVLMSALLIILFLYTVATENVIETKSMEDVLNGTNLTISCICLLTIPITMWQMSSLLFRDEEMQLIKDNMKVSNGASTSHNGITNSTTRFSQKGSLVRAIDRQLLGATTIFLFVFHTMSIIAAVECKSNMLLANSVLSIMMACVQTVFINWYAGQKRSTTEEDLCKKPGRQGLEVLRCANFALWLTNTFLVKHPTSKYVHNHAFGAIPWAVVSNICLPLLILYHFHAFCCLAEVISHSYTEEYIGVIRPLKVPSMLLAAQLGSIKHMDTENSEGSLTWNTASENIAQQYTDKQPEIIIHDEVTGIRF